MYPHAKHRFLQGGVQAITSLYKLWKWLVIPRSQAKLIVVHGSGKNGDPDVSLYFSTLQYAHGENNINWNNPEFD